MASGIIEIVKRAALDAINNEQLCDLRYGTVVNTNPLRVQVTSQLILPSSLLVVPEHLTNYEVEVSIDGVPSKMTINGSLKVNDKVALLRKHGGQSYFILDRI